MLVQLKYFNRRILHRNKCLNLAREEGREAKHLPRDYAVLARSHSIERYDVQTFYPVTPTASVLQHSDVWVMKCLFFHNSHLLCPCTFSFCSKNGQNHDFDEQVTYFRQLLPLPRSHIIRIISIQFSFRHCDQLQLRGWRPGRRLLLYSMLNWWFNLLQCRAAVCCGRKGRKLLPVCAHYPTASSPRPNVLLRSSPSVCLSL